MSTGAIIARLGLDTTSFRAGLLNAANQAEAGAKRIGASLLSGKKSSDILGDSLSGIGGALKFAGPIGLAVTAMGALVKMSADAREETRKLNEEIAKLTQLQGSSDFQTLDSIKSRVSEIDKQIQSLVDKAGKDGFFNSLGANIAAFKDNALNAGIFGGSDDLVGDRERIESVLRKAKQRDLDAIAEKSKRINDIEDERLHGSERQAALDKIRAEFNEKLSSTNDNPAARQELYRQQALSEEVANRAYDAKQRALDLERNILAVTNQGLEVAVQAAQARLNAANAEYEVAAGTENQDTALLKAQAAQLDLDVAQKKSDELRAQLALEKEIAETKASPEEKQRMRLEGEARLIEARQKDTRTKPDEQRQLEIDAAKKQADQRAAERASREAGYQTGDSRIDAETGTGAAAKIEALRQKLALAVEKAKEFAADSERSQSEIAGAYAAATALRNQLEEAARAQEDAAEAASEGTKILLAQTRGQETLAGKLQAEERYRKAINQALRDGNTVLAAQLTAQQKLTVGQESFKDWKKPPEQRRQERQGERDTAREQRAYEREVAGVKGAMDRGVTGMTGRRGRIAEDIKAGRIDPNDPLGAKSLSKTSPAGKFLNGSVQSLTQGQEGKAMLSKLDELKVVLEKIEKKEIGNL